MQGLGLYCLRSVLVPSTNTHAYSNPLKTIKIIWSSNLKLTGAYIMCHESSLLRIVYLYANVQNIVHSIVLCLVSSSWTVFPCCACEFVEIFLTLLLYYKVKAHKIDLTPVDLDLVEYSKDNSETKMYHHGAALMKS